MNTNLEKSAPDYWRKELKNAFRSPKELLEHLNLDPNDPKWDLNPRFPTLVPRGFAQNIRKNDPNDPILLQVLPQQCENKITSGYSLDPLCEQDFAHPGLLHKYQGRVLIPASPNCAIHCRYCFRQHQDSDSQWDKAIAYIQENDSIKEVILSGGDPLSLPDSFLQKKVDLLGQSPHLQRLRIHSRTPIVIPERIQNDFINSFKSLPDRINKIMVLHFNHPNELNSATQEMVQTLRAHSWLIFSQSVLLKGVNDNLETLVELCEKGFSQGIQPYYLHQLDKVQGAAHFEVSDSNALQLIQELRENLPGYLLPQLVRELAGEKSKTPL